MNPADLTAFLASQRWFAGKGRPFEVADVREVAVLGAGVRICVVDVAYADGGSETYQLPLVRYDEPQERLAHALIGPLDGGHAYDAVHDREAMSAYLAAVHRVGAHEIDPEAHSTLFGGEQSNSSVAFGEDAMLKVFRKLTPGRNPDIEVHEALTAAANTHVAHLYGWLSADGTDLAMLQQFLRTATDGWDLALASVRNLFAEQDLHADEVGGDFAAESTRLGVAVAEVHGDLRTAFGATTASGPDIAERMRRRFADVRGVVPELAAHARGLDALYDRVSALGTVPTQRIHGDLHLGQTLRTSLGWKLVDFEGEPARPLEERRLPDGPWRDLAGMLRSFDYAAHVVLGDFTSDIAPDPEVTSMLDYRAHEWTARNSAAFLEGYGELDDDARTLLAAYEADKAVYECGYEARNRPAWLAIPLRAVERLAR